MALGNVRSTTIADSTVAEHRHLAWRWQGAVPVMVLIAVFLASLLGLYGAGRALESRFLGPAGRNAAAASAAAPSAFDDAKSLTRLGWSEPNVPADVMLVTPDYFHAVGWVPTAEMNTHDFVVFLVAENIHDGDLPPMDVPTLLLGGLDLHAVAHTKIMAASPHHRTTAVMFKRPSVLLPGMIADFSLVFPHSPDSGPGSLHWEGIVLQEGGAGSGTPTFHLTGAGILALLAGMLASMWPCLFQLTAYFIPSLAGISMAEVRGGQVPAAVRWRVVKMATFFVMGFVIVYTLAGAAAGIAARSFDTRSAFETWRRPLTVTAGIVMLALALRQAAKARLPVVCKMPLLGHIGNGPRPGYGSAMLMGLAYATGCATCFGAAVLVGMLVYVGASGAPFTGAIVMFLFSVGMGVPLVVGASLLARVLPVLERFDNASRYIALASSGLMLAMAVLLLSDHFMGFSNTVARLLG